MKIKYISRIELIKEQEKKVVNDLTREMLDTSKKERKIWISGQSLSKLL